MLLPPAELVGRAKATVRECSVTDVNERPDNITIVIDIREPAEYACGRLPGATHIPRGVLEFEIHGLVEKHRGNEGTGDAENHPIVLYCGTGGRSALAAATLAELGYTNVTSMAGGVAAWKQAGLKLETP